MLVRMKSTKCTPEYSLCAGARYELEDKLAKKLIKEGHAERIGDAPAVVEQKQQTRQVETATKNPEENK